MKELEDGYYWAKDEGVDSLEIIEHDGGVWYVFGSEYEFGKLPTGYVVIGKVEPFNGSN